jgi:hypothetical protein
MKTILIAISILGSSTLLNAAVGISHITSAGGNMFHVDQKFDKSDYTGFLFSFISGSTYQYGGSLLDEGLDMYRVFSGNTFTPAAISNGNFLKLNAGSNYSLSSIFYVGLETPSREAGFATLPPAYGWARMSSSGGVLTLLDHAIDYSGNGLIVGTTTVVPEPGVTGLIAIGLTCILTRRCRTRR